MLAPVPKNNVLANQPFSEYWLQELIAAALSYGISKRELFEDYYITEVPEILKRCAGLRGLSIGGGDTGYVGAGEFFGGNL